MGSSASSGLDKEELRTPQKGRTQNNSDFMEINQGTWPLLQKDQYGDGAESTKAELRTASPESLAYAVLSTSWHWMSPEHAKKDTQD